MRSRPEPPPLAETQRLFAAALLGDADGATPLLAQLRGQADANRRRLAAYRRNVIGNWVGALRSTYPVVATALGEAAFRRLAADYALNHASPSGDLNEYGADFPDHLAALAEVDELPWLTDLARLEWALQAAYYAADADPFDFAALAGVPPELHAGLRFRLAPALCSVVSDWPLAALWHELQAEPSARPTPGRGRYHTWVVRPFVRVWPEAASAGEAAFMTALAADATLAGAIDAALAIDAGFDASATLGRAAGLGLLAGFLRQGEAS